MKKQIALSALLVALVFGLSCNKDNNNNPTPKTKTQLLTQSSWRFKSATANGADASGFLQACQKDNILVFASAGTGTLDEGASKCNAGDPQTNPFTWNFLASETTLHISTVLFTGGSSDFAINSLTETELVLQQAYTPVAGPTFQIVVTFQH